MNLFLNMTTIKRRLLALLLAGAGSILNVGAESDQPVAVYVTAKDTGQLLAKAPDLHFVALPQPSEKQPCVFVDPGSAFQTLLGIGGALTDASAETFTSCPKRSSRNCCAPILTPRTASAIRWGARISIAVIFPARTIRM